MWPHSAVIWSSFAMAPATVVLFVAGCDVAWIYLASLVITVLYHLANEKRFKRADHVLAYSVVAANGWMAANTSQPFLTMVGISWVLVALDFYFGAKRAFYNRRHTIWHLCCGAACLFFVLGYVR